MTPFIKLAAVSTPFFLAETATRKIGESTIEGVTSSALGEWLVQAAAAAVLIMALWTLVDRMRGGISQKREVTFSEEYTSKEEHDLLKAEVAKIDNERRVSVAKLHEKIDENTRITSETKGQLATINQQLQQINVHLINRGNR